MSNQFDSSLVIEDIVFPYVRSLKPHEKYILFRDMIKAENKALHTISKLEDYVIKILEIRNNERSEFKLKIELLDWDRNYKIKELLQNMVNT